jgi:hypothetical protein
LGKYGINRIDALKSLMIYFKRPEDAKPACELMSEHFVKSLLHPNLEQKGHCVTADNFFLAYKLAKHLLDVKATFVGTMRFNIPVASKPSGLCIRLCSVNKTKQV